MRRQIRRRMRSRIAAALLACGLAGVALPAAAVPTGQGTGNPTLSASPSTGLAASGKTTIQVRGIDYLVPPSAENVPVDGGIYVFFGWVDTAKKWGPSGRNINNTDGNFGTTYLYPGAGGSADSRDNGNGTVFISFSASGESGDATGFHMDRNGNWSVPIEVPGAVFTTELPGGAGTKTTDCRQVTCGVFTFGAHGKASATNEKFTPLSFAGGSTGGASGGATATPKPSSTPNVTTTVAPTPASATPKATTSGYDANGAPTRLPQTGIAEDFPVTVAPAPLDGSTVAVGVSAASDSGGGGLAMFGVAALVALVVALTASLFWRYGVRD
ncbi:hypothetical protein [Sporichthya polymorpha]|uniref:hypothetical protein n=1 Tax=Sporichthya polymorpha TaxID=35751 RepID=UPI0003A9E5FD|nr:hypothetical protein [Sporichthya polymorpha]